MNNQTLHMPVQSDHSRSSSPATTCVHKHFELEVEKDPERIALVHSGERITYAGLNERANQIAHHLLSKGVGQETLVAIAMERSPDLIACILGVIKAGGAYLPLDPDYPQERLSSILVDANTSVLLTNSSLAKRIPFTGSRLICIDDLRLDEENSDNPDIYISPDNLAYVMYTSGSTGQPKGVMVEHRSIVRLVKETDYADFGSENVFLQFAPITFDASTFEIWGALLNGAKLAIMPEGATSLADLGDAIREYGVTTLWLTAGLFHLIVDERIDDLRSLRQLLAGGDVLSVTHVQKVIDNLNCDLINGYGPTENTTFTCCYKVPRDKELGRSIPIGKPVAGSQIYFLDRQLRPVPEGEIGEIYIGGEGLARGYVNQPGLTMERFVTGPFPGVSSKRLYRSGDMGRLLPDGNVEFLGRVDNQIKIRGFRIELEEIETALVKQEGVRGAIAVVKGDAADDKQLFAFVVTDRQTEVDTNDLKSQIAKTLPAYMVPFRIVSVESFPLTANGKVDRNALIGTIGVETEGLSSFNPPKTDSEQKIAQMLGEVLGARAVRVNDNFFDLGASSLQIARLHNRLTTIFGSELKIVSLFQYPTVRALARSIDQRDTKEPMISELQARALRQREAYTRQRSINHGGSRP